MDGQARARGTAAGAPCSHAERTVEKARMRRTRPRNDESRTACATNQNTVTATDDVGEGGREEVADADDGRVHAIRPHSRVLSALCGSGSEKATPPPGWLPTAKLQTPVGNDRIIKTAVHK